MKQLQKIRPWVLVLTGAIVCGFAGRTARADEKIIIQSQPTTYHYVYYPDAEIYLVPDRHEYWIMEGGRWRMVTEVPAGIALGTSVTLDLDRPEPWRTHETIVKKYGGKHHKEKIKETIKNEDGTTTRETIRDKDGDVKIKEKTKEKDND